MSLEEIWPAFVTGMKEASLLEYVAVFAGILSVWFSRLENIWVYPIGLVSTIIYVYISFKYHLIGEASVNIYYTVLSFYGWFLWARKNNGGVPILRISFSTRTEWLIQLSFFAGLFLVIYCCLIYLKTAFYPGVIPLGDAFASATAYTGMWLMAKKKVESWLWWIATNTASIPLYFIKGLVFTSVFYFVLLLMAFFGLVEWMRKGRQAKMIHITA